MPLVILQRRKPLKANAKACCLQSKPKDLEGNRVINFLQYVNHTLLMGMQVHDSTRPDIGICCVNELHDEGTRTTHEHNPKP